GAVEELIGRHGMQCWLDHRVRATLGRSLDNALASIRAMNTERPSPRYSDIDVWDPTDIAEAMIEGQFTAVAAVRAARFALVTAALAAEARLRNGGRLVYVGAGTSGRLAVQDGAELIPTFNWPQDRLVLPVWGGKDALLASVGGGGGGGVQAILVFFTRAH